MPGIIDANWRSLFLPPIDLSSCHPWPRHIQPWLMVRCTSQFAVFRILAIPSFESDKSAGRLAKSQHGRYVLRGLWIILQFPVRTFHVHIYLPLATLILQLSGEKQTLFTHVSLFRAWMSSRFSVFHITMLTQRHQTPKRTCYHQERMRVKW
jgi:hypothetical protein